MRVLIWTVALVVFGLAGSYVLSSYLQPALSDTERARLRDAGLAEDFVQLSDGIVHYRDEGRGDAPTILMVHGFSTPSFVYEDYFASLVDADFRAVSMDTYGRGYSARPDRPYDQALFLGQIKDLAVELELEVPFHLVGYSMGGGVVADYAAAYPEDVASLTLIAPLGFSDVGGTASNLTAPLVGDWIVHVLGPRLLGGYLEQGLEKAPDPAKFIERFRDQAAYRGYYDALLSTLRHYPFATREAEHRFIAAAGIPVLSFWGDKDEVIPLNGKDNLAAWNPEAKIVVLEGGTHSITYARAPEIVAHIASVLAPSIPIE